jgi:lipopolysaccharide export system permease protein
MIGTGAAVIFLADYVEVLRRFSDEETYTALRGIMLAAMHVPAIIEIALPFAFLFGAIFALLELSAKLELVVARASGVSVWGFLRAPFLVAILFGIAATTLLNPLAVMMREKSELLEADLRGRPVGGEGHWFRQEGGEGSSIINAASADPDGRTLVGVNAYVYRKNGSLKEKVEARRAAYEPGRWILADATVISAESAPGTVARYELPTTLTASEVSRRFATPDTTSFWALPASIETARRVGLDPNPFRVVFHSLVNRPVMFLAMVLIAATVSLRLTRYGGTWKLILAGAAIGFLLYAFGEIASDLGGNGIIDPVLAAWLPPVVALTFGATALLYQEDG